MLTSSPLSFSSVRTPLLPVSLPLSVLLQSLLLGAEVFLVVDDDHDSGRDPEYGDRKIVTG